MSTRQVQQALNSLAHWVGIVEYHIPGRSFWARFKRRYRSVRQGRARPMDECSEITAAATRFRSLIESNNDCLPDHLRDFPAGCCSDVSDMLATHLSAEGFGSFKLIQAQRGRHGDQDNPFRTHAWLRQGTLTIDITGDQFPDFQQPILVSDSSPWHEGFDIRDVRPAGLIWIDGPIRPALDDAYKRILSRL